MPCVFAVQLFCLLIMGAVEFLNMTDGCFRQIPVSMLMNVGIMLSLLGFWGITILKSPRAFLRRDVILGIVMVLWFLILEMNRRINHIPLQSFTIFTVIYLLALPFAAITQDQNRQFGIRLVSVIYLAASLLCVTVGLILFAGGNLSSSSQYYKPYVYNCLCDLHGLLWTSKANMGKSTDACSCVFPVCGHCSGQLPCCDCAVLLHPCGQCVFLDWH